MNITLDTRTTKYPLPAAWWTTVINECANPHMVTFKKEIARRCMVPVQTIKVQPSTMSVDGQPFITDGWPTDRDGNAARDMRVKVKIIVDASDLPEHAVAALEEIAAGLTAARMLRAFEARFRAYEAKLEIIKPKRMESANGVQQNGTGAVGR